MQETNEKIFTYAASKRGIDMELRALLEFVKDATRLYRAGDTEAAYSKIKQVEKTAEHIAGWLKPEESGFGNQVDISA